MKYKELSQKPREVLVKDLADLRDQMMTLRVKSRLSQVKTTHQIGQVRKDIARIMTSLKANS